ncbi:MAG: trypsin-like peptidase domain-containing protein [Ardenticatenaceae bacterium]|nr:trypsin-like peptidase domain-containing protein [Ardenticatenaceae bacterium]
MKTFLKQPLVYGLVLLMLLAACAQENPAPTVDTAVIAATVQAQVMTDLKQPTIPTPAAANLTALIEAEVASQLRQMAAPTPTPTNVTALVEDEVTTQLTETAVDLLNSAEIARLIEDEITDQLAEMADETLTPDQIAELIRSQVDLYLDQVQPTIVANNALNSLGDSQLEQSLINVYQAANPSVVYIIVPPVGTGSGFVYSEDGYIVTNNHVVADGFSYEIAFANGDRRSAELVGTDVDSDLAVLKVADLPAGIRPLTLGNSDDIQVGQLTVAIGNPFGEQGSMSLGIISALGRSLTSQRGLTDSSSSYSLPQVIQTDAPINPGNSGGPLLNLQAEVIGINAAISTETGTNSGVGYAIPVNAVHRIVPSLIANGSYTYPYMGAGFDDELSLDEQIVFDLPQTQGAYVLSVVPNGPSDQAGLIAANPVTGRDGDLIVALDGTAINNFADLNAYLTFHTEPDQTIEVTILRDGELETLLLTLGERP